MRLPSGAISILLLTATSIRPTLATPPVGDLSTLEASTDNSTIVARCANPCGYYGQVCCQSGETCFTDANNQAQCGPASGGSSGAMTTAAPGGSGYWQYSTSTWVETNTVTKTQVYSTWVAGGATAHPTTPAVVSTAVPVNCQWAQGESSCGNICCPSGQYCQVSGQCAPAGSPSAPLRPTSSGTGVVTQTSFSTTTTVPFGTPIATGASSSMNVTQTSSTSSSGLSGGAIAGIVIGSIFGLLLLILLILCLCARTAWEGLLAIFGLGKRRRGGRREVVEYESYHRSGRNSGGAAAAGRTWYGGGRPARVGERIDERRDIRNTNTRRTGGFGASLGGIATAMGLRRKRDERRREEEKSDVTSYMYSESDYTASSDRRTRDTRRTSRR